MKGLAQFRKFDWENFSKGKTFQVTAVSNWTDHDTGKHLGRRVESVITMDTTSYEFRRGEQFTDLYEKITFKVEGDAEAPIGATVIPVEAVARCYGDYQNQLSVVCKALRVVPQAPAAAAKGQN